MVPGEQARGRAKRSALQDEHAVPRGVTWCEVDREQKLPKG